MASLLGRLHYETSDVQMLLHSNAPLAEKDAAVRAAFETEMDPDLRWVAETQLSIRMLDAYVEDARTGYADLDAIAFYTTRLVNHGNVNADRLASALRLLEGFWSPDEIAEAANQARAAAVEYLGATARTAGPPRTHRHWPRLIADR